jgi:hypothetical protein
MIVLRLAAAALVVTAVAFPLAVLPSPPVTWLAVGAVLVAGAGVALLSVPLVTAGASLALIAYAIALVVVKPPADPLVAMALGGTLVVLLALVHLAGRVDGAALGRGVAVAQLRQWLAVIAAGVLMTIALTAGGAVVASVLAGATLPVVVVAAALGALLAVAGVVALLASRRAPPTGS